MRLMKYVYLSIAALCLLYSCKNENKDTRRVDVDTNPVTNTKESSMNYPVPLEEILRVHGGMDRWTDMKQMSFEFDTRTGTETHTISLPDRRTRIETENWAIGFDGQDVWKAERSEGAYKGDPVFYYNLMFYFYAMPFVLGDAGIQYEEMKATELNGKVYEAIKISYDAGVGNSSKDNYILYYDLGTHRMTWLAYTVTYKDDQPNENWRFIEYTEWQDVNGFQLPKKLTWYTVQDGKPVQARNFRIFENASISVIKADDGLFTIPENAEVVSGN